MWKRRTNKAPEPENVSQLRDAIDRGCTGDKVAAEDPAAAPLGTDEEAGGQPLGAPHFEALKSQRLKGQPPPEKRWLRGVALAAALCLAAALTLLALALSP